MAEQRNSPSDVILDMLRSGRQRRQRVSALIRAGALFGFTDNTVRVTLSRLQARGIIDSPARGVYQLTRQTDALNDFVERWRLGEHRVRPWHPGRWWFAATGNESCGRSLWALSALGFRAVAPGLHARPDNLALTLAELRQLATGLALSHEVQFISGEPEDNPVPAAWIAAWQPQSLNASYARLLQRLRDSRKRLTRLPVDQARLECFSLGGEAIHLLAKDPLLPEQLVDVAARTALWQAMLEYDAAGRDVWALAADDVPLNMPRPQLRPPLQPQLSETA